MTRQPSVESQTVRKAVDPEQHLHRLFSQGIAFYLHRYLPSSALKSHVSSIIQEVHLTVGDPDKRTLHEMAALILSCSRRHVTGLPPTEPQPQCQSDAHVLYSYLLACPSHQRQALLRFYLSGQSPQQIEYETGISSTELLRHRTNCRHFFTAVAAGQNSVN